LHTVSTVVVADATALAPLLDGLAATEYQTGRAGQPAPPVWNQPPAIGELWLMAVARPGSNVGEWVIYAITSEDDIPGWPYRTNEYTGGLRTAEDFAQPYVNAGHQVVLRHYDTFAITSVATDVPLIN
jgi:hypothetical protein